MSWRQGEPWTMHLKPGSSWQSALHPSPAAVLPSSHCSLSVTLPSPQTPPPPPPPSGLFACCPPHAKKQRAVHKTSWRITHQTTHRREKTQCLLPQVSLTCRIATSVGRSAMASTCPRCLQVHGLLGSGAPAPA